MKKTNITMQVYLLFVDRAVQSHKAPRSCAIPLLQNFQIDYFIIFLDKMYNKLLFCYY